MASISLSDAAALAEASYDIERITSPRRLKSCPHRDVQAHVLEGNILLLPGSNTVRDYLKYNLRPLRLGEKRLRLRDGGKDKGASGTFWHQGFLAYAKVVFDWLKEENIKPETIIGHSLGAAAAQILSKSYETPAIGFAAPRPKFVKGPVKNDKLCLIINRNDDIVPKLPSGFHHMGVTKLLAPPPQNFFSSHKMTSYKATTKAAQKSGALPHSWP
ncbi:hypothetical protein [Planktotalea sp.]|uniref:hypothetical protein n=1 Tax=Planktotalea sp. TaxID=2029877 RepID=UPI003297B2D9